MARLDGKVAIITGAAGGIGAAAARHFAAEGAKLMLVDLEEAALASLAGEIGEDAAATQVADVADAGQTQAYVDATVARFGGVDIALLNAGIEGQVGSIVDTPVQMFDKVMAINVRGVWLGLKSVLPAIEKRGGGSIVITSSTSGIRAIPNFSPYTASKHAVIGIMRAAALEGAASNIRVNTVNPSPIDTRMIVSIEEMMGVGDQHGSNSPMAMATPLKRYGEPEEVASLMLFLASDESSFCTGGVYMVDGGVSAGRL
ncbi:MAG: SDR family oxidoreductase [Alphaproteobacteria bacterium]|jgi:NAD(P)-dependent dehydrogenase (short-subunit alcohol dehydrogenase family)|nr:SDR family oxidoreductase [Alphaproteobacteria bacterium]